MAVVVTGTRPTLTVRASYEAFGASCASTGPLPTLAAQSGSLPRTGSTLVTEITNLSTGARPFLFMGLSNTFWNGIPLPLELSLLGLPGCHLLTSDDLVIPLLNASGTATLSLPIPLNPRFHGAEFYHQAIVFSPTFQLTAVSNGAVATIGQ